MLLTGCIWSMLISLSDSAAPNVTTKVNEVCYPEIGCLNLDPPWDPRTLLGRIPQPPSAVGLRLFHRSRYFNGRRETNLEGVEKMVADAWNSTIGNFKAPARSCTLIIHGFASSGSVPWTVSLEEALIDSEDTEVVIVDWSPGASGPNYFQAVANTRVAAALVAKFLQKMIQKEVCDASKLHLIGQSLGAHLASYVATDVTNIAEITGLDPAQPWFENNDNVTHLDQSDAEFVQIVHTNVLPFWPSFGLGFSKPSGHVDFYINGGAVQPECTSNGYYQKIRNYLSDRVTSVIEWLACSHSKAQEYYIEALKRPFSCRYTGIPWNPDDKDPPSLRGHRCRFASCQQIGRLTKHLPARGTFYVFSNYTDPFCLKESAH
ncbi:Hypothetical protein NTJ_12689 [Nesidiocoris tenuis]|uniref:Lipase domain-containing protein n=1 Tax=Nesidiocoris tenuis TaxID=355587 RepID=A0ABN7B9N2_9HEMI|nr:Hypothetical protein NTJ_12689 [Nesidiocoris tenuis]